MSKKQKPTNPLDSDSICMAFDELARPHIQEAEVFKNLDSSNTYLLGQVIDVGLARVCAVESQSKGRGRRGNEWLSAPNKNIMMSMSWGFAQWPASITGLGLAVALIVAERLNADHQLDVEIKWPNDLLINGDKLAGVLVDVIGEARGACNVVLGLGLNVRQDDWSKSDAGYAWTDLHSLGIELDRNEFVGHIVSDWVAMLQSFESNGFAPLAERWAKLSSYADKKIAVGDPTSKIVGRMQGVDQTGALVVKSDDGKEHVFSDSNVSVRLVD